MAKGDNSNNIRNPLSSILKQSDDCERPACEETVSALSDALNRINKRRAAVTDASATTTTSSSSDTTNVTCPPTKDFIGKSTWTLLHSMAAWYPDHPSLEEQMKMSQFVDALSTFYPCTYCAQDFKENLKKDPVKVSSRKDLCMWFCDQHNLVNEKLGKRIFKCDMDKLDKRWRKNSDC